MRVRFTKNPPAAGNDVLLCERADGSTTSLVMSRQGILPHAAIHFVVESTLGLRDARFGLIARGESLDHASSRFDAPRARARHAASPRSLKSVGSDESREARQTEALVECLQLELSTGASDHAAFSRTLAAKCRQRGVAAPAFSTEELDRVRIALREFGAAWRPLAPGRSLERNFPA